MHIPPISRHARPWLLLVSVALGSGCGAETLEGDPAVVCAALAAAVPASALVLPSAGARIASAALMPASPLKVGKPGPWPGAGIQPATPAYCQVQGRIGPVDPAAPPIQFQVNLPLQWNGRSLQYGGGGFNGVLVSGVDLLPAARFDRPAPLAQGFVTYGTDSGHQSQPGEPLQAFALNEEALVNFAHASYKKVRDVALVLMHRAYGRGPERMYFMGSSEGGREALTMAQRYPADFDGIFSHVPVVNWTGLQHAGVRNGLATMGQGWLGPAQVKLVSDTVLAACDGADGLKDGLVSDMLGCQRRFDVAALLCKGAAGGDDCLNQAQVQAVQTLHAPYRFAFALANGVTEYPGRGVSGEGLGPLGIAGGWRPWWLGAAPPSRQPTSADPLAWVFGSGALRYFFARDPQADLQRYQPEQHAARVRQVSALMDATDPDLSAFQAHGGKLILMENLADYAQSPLAGIGYYQSVVARMGQPKADGFVRLYMAPGVDHVGFGGPANVDMLPALVAWVERGKPPAGLELAEQSSQPPFEVARTRPLCAWPSWPRYRGAGDARLAASFACTP
ncbi:tannase/feruloyl esterase family alpha/beta hydrolase [Comamonas sp. GB3 AK4-5]|uniref:tannase/feruloyl esterase family alpha/beta hydrolase n=1 Tax=Comamonas sp. GB3 AK4-5 TaxID=3231487 RepID=UPI00351EC33D